MTEKMTVVEDLPDKERRIESKGKGKGKGIEATDDASLVKLQ